MDNDSRRRSAVWGAVEDAAVDALLITRPANVRYLTGFTGTNGWLLLAANDAVFVTDPRYREQAARQVGGAAVEISTSGLDAVVGEVCRTRGWRRVAFEAAHVTVAGLSKLQSELEAEWAPLEDVVEPVRAAKDAGEIDAIRAALALAEAALEEVATSLTPGQTEIEVAAAIEFACRRGGAERMSFDTIVASGPRSALPHGVASNRRLLAGEPLMIDMGCVLNGYCSDITRMVWLQGEPDRKWLELHELVDRARAAGVAAVAAGVSGREVDAAARRVIEDAGYGAAFSHGTGHGVGVDIHEAPTLSSRGKGELAVGMVATIEPAIYLEGDFGIRIEDMVVVAEGGCERLTTLDTDPILR